MDAAFTVGQTIRLRADAARQGAIIELLPPVAGLARYRVFHEANAIRDYEEGQLIAVDLHPAGEPLDAIGMADPLDAPTFRARLAAARLGHAQVDTLYAFHAARIQHIPFQFKPLLRFLRADRPRLLIADEVGVGKTIEAGLILKELDARKRINNVLIVCPKALVAKWRMEMRRFDEDFQPLSADTLRYCLDEADLEGEWPRRYARAIVHLELLRSDDYRLGTDGRNRHPGLRTLNPAPRFSLTIVDEAHHVRNPGTNSHDLADFLCQASEAVVFLSATPVQLGAANLYALLHLLRPDLFRDAAVFDAMMAPNRHLTAAIRHLRGVGPEGIGRQPAALTALRAAADTSWGGQVLAPDPQFARWQDRLEASAPLSDVERVRCIRDLEELHTLAHVMNRTRRRDIGRFTTRDPQTVSVPFTAPQQQFYDALIAFRYQVLSARYDPRVARLIIDTLERQAASCLPALIPALDGFLRTGRFSLGQVSDDGDEDVTVEVSPHFVQGAGTLRSLAAQLPADDPKLERLLEIARASNAADGPGKVLIFSFFLHTLSYLEVRLRQAGNRVAVITGKVPDDERERLRDRFRLPREHPESLDLLLSSEVGCEGLDYEFCDRLVNYDIPWNPMRIEQRIGRIDRFGQRAEKILIYNFITPGTVEERIFFRCFDRLGVFRDTVGDLEEVLGEVTQDLTKLALDPRLTAEQADEQSRQVADNAIRLAEERRRLEEESGALLGLDQSFVAEVDSLEAEGRHVAPGDLRLMISRFLIDAGIGGQFTTTDLGSAIYRFRLGRDGRAMLLARVRALDLRDRATLAFTRWLEGDESGFVLTFDQPTALEHRDVAFVTPVHGLARAAVAHWSTRTDPLFASLTVDDDTVRPGPYLFTCDLWEVIGARPEVRLASFAWDLDEGSEQPAVAARLSGLLGRARTGQPPAERLVALVTRDRPRLDEGTQRARADALRELAESNDVVVARRLASLDTYYGTRLRQVRVDLAQANQELIVRMRKAEQANLERDRDRLLREVAGQRTVDILVHRVATGIIEVQHGE